MFKANLTAALRGIRNNKVHSFISIFGLAIGLTAGILILLWCEDERTYNQSIAGGPNVYRVVAKFDSKGNKWYFPDVPPAVGAASKQVAGIEKQGRLIGNGDEMLFQYNGKSFTERRSANVDPELFDILDFTFVEGSRETPFRDKQSIVLTEALAKKYFGKEEALGKVLFRKDKNESYVVTGVVRSPHNSQTEFDFFRPQLTGVEGDWVDYDFETYIRLTPGATLGPVAARLTQLQKAAASDDLTKALNYGLQPLAEVHLYNADGSDGLITMVRVFTGVAFVILLIAAINYVNLTTAKAAQRAREIGVRKIIGAGKRQLFFQFMSESVIVFVLAMIASVLLVKLVFPAYNSLIGKELAFDLFSPSVLKVLGLTMAVTLIASAIYPAILLSSFKPLQAIKGKFSIGRGNHFLRKFLVVGQFGFSVVFIICTIIIGRQLSYIQAKNLGMNRENVFRIELKKMYGNFAAVNNELQKNTAIEGVTAAGQNMLDVAANTTQNDWAGKEPGKTFLIATLPVERGFLSTMKIPLVEGKEFSGTAADSGNYILNETAVREMGLKDPVGKTFTLFNRKGVIAGVVRDFHFKDMHRKIGPCVIFWKPEWMGQLYVRTTGARTQEAIAAVQKLWKVYNPDYPMEYHFLDEVYDKMYATDRRTSTLFKVFASIAIFISCLGLFGLMTYTAQLKTREIGIRKVLGATVMSVTGLLARDFIRLVLLAIVIASPVGWYFMDRWLQDFAYRIPLPWWVFPVAGLCALGIALATVGFQAVKAALANPVDALRRD